ncbi:MAG TPA: histidinol-phosphate transaminase [bacterium (Candidatus Stahlbacteria)]|nr:histidinol-phosphate transaminase [Candidatus Stahlbacteria bacterium]
MIEPRECLHRVTPYPMPEPGRKTKTRLDMNENTRGCSPRVLDAIKNINQDDIAAYPEYQGLIEKLAHFHNVRPENLLLTNGADDAFRCIMATYLDSRHQVILPIPIYPMFEIFARQNGAQVTEVLYNQDLSFPTEKVINAINEKTKMVVIVNPGNPTGTTITRKELIRILTAAKTAVVLLDETYYQFTEESFIPLIKDFANLIITQSFSKVFGLAGLRIGFIVSNSDNIIHLNKVNLPFSVNTIALIAAKTALDDDAYIDEYVYEVKNERRFLYEKLQKMGFDVRMTDANFILLYLGDQCNRIHQELKYRNVLVKNLKGYPQLDGFLRITIGTHSENLVFLEVLEDIIRTGTK